MDNSSLGFKFTRHASRRVEISKRMVEVALKHASDCIRLDIFEK